MVTATSGGGGPSAPGRPQLDIHATADALNLPTTSNRFDACLVCGGGTSAQLYDHHFHCFRSNCQAHGSAIDLIALVLDLVTPDDDGRFTRLNAEQMSKVQAWLRAHPIAAAPKPKVEPATLRSKHTAEVSIIWTAAGRVDEDSQVSGWLSGDRKLDPKVLADLDLCRRLPHDAERFDGCSRWRKGYRVLVPVYGPTGGLEALRGRWTLVSDPPSGKSTHPMGWGSGAMTGCLYANPVAVKMLRGELTEPITLVGSKASPTSSPGPPGAPTSRWWASGPARGARPSRQSSPTGPPWCCGLITTRTAQATVTPRRWAPRWKAG